MILFKTAADLRRHLSRPEFDCRTAGFVPTMGALHKGHIELLKHSKENTYVSIVSIFVNPTQFNDPADFAKYPVTTDRDLLLLEENGCDIVLLPPVEEIYPDGPTLVHPFHLGYLETILEGKYRPGHFQGVCQVVKRLLDIVRPSTLFLGRKDYQQCLVIKRLIELSGMHTGLALVPTVREVSGLAMSSRNQRLTEAQREQAAVIYRSLQYIKERVQRGNVQPLIDGAMQMILQGGFEKIDYVSVADADTLLPVTEWDGRTPLIALTAAFIGGVRLIDNLLLNPQ